MYGIRTYSSFIIFHVADQFSQHHLSKRLSFPLCILASFVKNKVPIDAWHYLLVYYLVFVVVVVFVFLESMY